MEVRLTDGRVYLREAECLRGCRRKRRFQVPILITSFIGYLFATIEKLWTRYSLLCVA